MKERFSDKRMELLALVAEGMTNEAIGKVLHISVNTVKKRLDDMRGLLKVHTRGELVDYYLQIATDERREGHARSHGKKFRLPSQQVLLLKTMAANPKASNKKLAALLNVTESTVKNYLYAIGRTLNCTGPNMRVRLITYYVLVHSK